MNNSVDDFSVAIAILNRKIAELNIKLSLNKISEEELKKYLDIKKKIYDGDSLLIKKIVDGEII